MPNSRLYKPKSGGGGTPGIILKDHGAPLGTITSLDVQGASVVGSLAGPGAGVITSPPPPPPSFGYWSGGHTFAALTRALDRLAFANDAVAMVNLGNLASTLSNWIGANSALNGYFFSTFNTGPVDRMVFATDALAMVAVNALPAVGFTQGSCNSATHAYTGGYDPGGNVGSTTCLSLDFANDANPMVVVGAYTTNRQGVTGTNNATNGYWAGSVAASTVPFAACDKMVFANDALPMTAAGALALAVVGCGGANSATFGYYSGGLTNTFYPGFGPFPVTAFTSRLDFANDANPMVSKGALSLAHTPAGSNSTLKAYFAGGYTSVNNVYTAVCNALTFATDSAAQAVVGSLSSAKVGSGSCQSGGIL